MKEFDLHKIEGIDGSQAQIYLTTPGIAWKMITNYRKIIDFKIQEIMDYVEKGMIHEYTVEVHGLKGSSRMIGATKMGDEFEELERLGKAGDLEGIKKHTPEVLEDYSRFKEYLQLFSEDVEKTVVVTREKILFECEKLKKAIDEFDIDRIEQSGVEFQKYILPEVFEKVIEKLDMAAQLLDTIELAECVEQIEQLAKETEI